MSLTAAIRTNTSGIGSGGQPLIEKTAKTLHLYIVITATGSYSTGGDTLDLTQVFGTGGLPGYSFPLASLPEKIEILSVKPAATPQTNSFVYQYAPGTTLANGKMQVFTGAAAQTALTELSAGAYPAGVLADIIEAEVTIPVP